mmetsp:Transcript_29098/g.68072  ORF Transcript_29098/g.68072 Transcript_29098/m.68072 type:complete len:263 (+) Transcript_29098:492-1280(+)
MPRADASDLAETLVRLAGELGDVPPGDNTLEAVTLGDGHAVDHLVLLEDALDGHLLLEELVPKVHLVGDLATVDLDLHDVGLLLADRGLGDLGVGDDADDLAVLLDLLELLLRVLRLVALLLGVLGEGLLGLGLVPVLVEAAAELVGQMLGPDGGEGAETAGGLDVAHHPDDNHGRGLDHRHGLDGLLLVRLGARLVNVTDDVRHASLVAHEGGEVAGLAGIVAGEAPDLALVVSATLAGKETQRAVPRALVLTMRHRAREW